MLYLSNFELESLLLSLKVGVSATILTLPLAIYAAWILARKDFVGKPLFTGIIYLPMVMPPVVIGLLLLTFLNPSTPLGQFLNSLGIDFAFNWKGAALAASIMAFPLMVRAIQISFDAIPTALEETASSLGSSPIKIFWTITLPLASPGLLSATILGFARSLGEFGATITFVSNIPGETQTLPLALYTLTQFPDGQTDAFRLAFLSAILSLAAVFISEWINRKRLKRWKG